MKTGHSVAQILSALLGILVFCSCGSKMNFSLGSEGDSFKQTGQSYNNQLDVLWVIDNSGSMGPYQDNLSQNFKSFISQFVARGYDMNVAVTTTDAYRASKKFSNDSKLSRYKDGLDTTSHTGKFILNSSMPDLEDLFVINAKQGTAGAGDERAFSSFREALTSKAKENEPFLRPGAFLAVVILSDEDDFSGDSRAVDGGTAHDYAAPTLDSVDSYVTFLEQLTMSKGSTKRFSVSTITVTDEKCLKEKGGGGSVIGKRNMELAQKTDGVIGNICDPSYAATLNAIQSQIIELSTQFFLKSEPTPGTIAVYIDGNKLPEDSHNGWTYNAKNNSILFHGSGVPRQGADIKAYYQAASVRN